jgi:uncharacterized membrane protein
MSRGGKAMSGGGDGILSVMNLIVIILLVTVVIYLYIRTQELSLYDNNNETQLKNFATDVNYNFWVVAQNNPDIVNL